MSADTYGYVVIRKQKTPRVSLARPGGAFDDHPPPPEKLLIKNEKNAD